jgi:hypothetical protein
MRRHVNTDMLRDRTDDLDCERCLVFADALFRGGHWRSGKQTPEGRKRISEGMRRHWEGWRAARELASTAKE